MEPLELPLCRWIAVSAKDLIAMEVTGDRWFSHPVTLRPKKTSPKILENTGNTGKYWKVLLSCAFPGAADCPVASVAWVVPKGFHHQQKGGRSGVNKKRWKDPCYS